MGVKTGPKLVIDHMITYQLIGMDEFWAALPPELSGLRDAGREAHRKAVLAATGQACAGCSSIKSAVGPIHDAVWRGLVDAAAPMHGIVDLVTAKRGYRPGPIEVYYKSAEGYPARLRF